MKICLLSRSHKPFDPRLHTRIGTSLKKKYEISIICRVDNDDTHLKRWIDGILYMGVPRPRKPRQDGINTFTIFRKAWNVNADIYICFELRTLFMGLIFKLFKGSKLIYDCHEFRPETYREVFTNRFGNHIITIYRKFEKFLVSCCDCIWCVNEHLASRLDPKNKKSIILPNYPRKNEFKFIKNLPKKIREKYDGRKVLIYVGGISENRGITACLYVMAYLKQIDKAAFLIFIGKTGKAYARKLDYIIKELEISKSVEFIGQIEHRNIPSYLILAELGIYLVQPVNPRYSMGEPIKYFEYTAAQLPVVMSDLPAKRTLIETYKNGILVDPKDYKSIAQNIANLICNENRLNRFKINSRNAFQSELNWEIIATRMYDSIIRVEKFNRKSGPLW
jgi:glycosyltransferase involved in cell wall biosynthesis